MKCTIKIGMDNAAFDDPGELPRILRKIADIVDGDGDNNHGGPVLDMNGNTVGLFQISGKRG
jgi:hypothetical protein